MKFTRQQILVFATVAVAVLFFGDKIFYTPLVNLWKARAKEASTLRTKIARGSATIRNETSIRGQWDRMRSNTLPDNQSLASDRVSKAFIDWGEARGVSLNAVVPQWRADTTDYKTVVCRVDASGTLWMLSRFIYNIENDPLGLKLESVDFNSRDNTGQQLTLGLTVSGLVLNSQEQ